MALQQSKDHTSETVSLTTVFPVVWQGSILHWEQSFLGRSFNAVFYFVKEIC